LRTALPIFANGWKEKRIDRCVKTVTRSAAVFKTE
jgi:hypothetical protein